MFNDNYEFIDTVALVMYRALMNDRRAKGYDDSEFTELPNEKKEEYRLMAREALRFLHNIHYY